MSDETLDLGDTGKLPIEEVTEAAAEKTDVPNTEATDPSWEMPKVVQREDPSPLPKIAIALVACALVGGLVAAILLLPGYEGDVSIGATNVTSGGDMVLVDVTIPISVPELDEKGSRVPVRISGKDADGTKRNEIGYVAFDGTGLQIPIGTYEIRVIDTPISATGTMYNLPLDTLTVTVDAGQHVAITPAGLVLELTPMHAESVIDSQIDQAKKMILADPQKKDLATKLAKLARQKRKKAVAAISGKKHDMKTADQANSADEDKDKDEENKDSGSNGNANANNDSSKKSSSSNDDKKSENVFDSKGKSSLDSKESDSPASSGGSEQPSQQESTPESTPDPGNANEGGQEQQPSAPESDTSDTGDGGGDQGGEGGTDGDAGQDSTGGDSTQPDQGDGGPTESSGE